MTKYWHPLFRWQSDGLLHTSGITGYLASHSGLLAMASPVAANLQICKEAKGQGQEVQAKGQSHKGSCPLLLRKGSCPLLSPFLYSLSKSKPQPKVNAYSACNEQITVGTAVSPHGPGATNPVRNRLVAGMFDHFWAGYPNSPANYIKFCNRLSNRDGTFSMPSARRAGRCNMMAVVKEVWNNLHLT